MKYRMPLDSRFLMWVVALAATVAVIIAIASERAYPAEAQYIYNRAKGCVAICMADEQFTRDQCVLLCSTGAK